MAREEKAMKKHAEEGDVPSYDKMLWPTLRALKALGGSGSNEEIFDKMIELESYSEKVQQVPQQGHHLTRLEYRSFWARTYLKKFGAIDSTGRGVWVLLDKGEKLAENEVEKIPSVVRKQGRLKREGKQKAENQNEENLEDEEQINWKEELLSVMQNIKPDAFERLCQRILRENGFTKVEVTGRSGDGGVDGVGILRLNLLSFHVSFQCKRYQGTVGSRDIRDFRGAMIGRGDKGLFITTGSFTTDARKEASRDGAPAIDLIDGEELCDILRHLKLGVQTEMIEKMTVNPKWFEGI